MKKLGVNIDHVATVRQARGGKEPDPVWAASIAEMAGADGIVVHLREDRRHIQDRDLKILKHTVRSRLILEMAATTEMLDIARDIRPDIVSVVPEKRMELTTEGGLDVSGRQDELREFIASLKQAGIAVSLFINPDQRQIKSSSKVDADMIELHTGEYANAGSPKEVQKHLNDLVQAARFGSKLGLCVNAGHGLDYTNIQPLVLVPEIKEFNIGHSIISRAILTGLDKAVRDMKSLISMK